MMIRSLKFFMIAGILGVGACSTSPVPDYTIRVMPATDGQTAQAIPPGCPGWSESDINFFDNQPLPQFGCADARNFAMMVDRPQDLLQGREPGPASGVLAAGSIMRYNNNQTRGLLNTGQQPDTSVDATTAPIANSSITGETSEGSSSSSSSSK